MFPANLNNPSTITATNKQITISSFFKTAYDICCIATSRITYTSNYYLNYVRSIYNRNINVQSNNAVISAEVFDEITHPFVMQKSVALLESLLIEVNYADYKQWLLNVLIKSDYAIASVAKYNSDYTPLEFAFYNFDHPLADFSIANKLLEIMNNKYITETNDTDNPLGWIINEQNLNNLYANQVVDFWLHIEIIAKLCTKYNQYLINIIPCLNKKISLLKTMIDFALNHNCTESLKTIITIIKKNKHYLEYISKQFAQKEAIRHELDIKTAKILYEFILNDCKIKIAGDTIIKILSLNDCLLTNLVINNIGVSIPIYYNKTQNKFDPRFLIAYHKCSTTTNYCLALDLYESALAAITHERNIYSINSIICADFNNLRYNCPSTKILLTNPMAIVIKKLNYNMLKILMAMGAKNCNSDVLLKLALGDDYQDILKDEYLKVRDIINNPASLQQIASANLAKYWLLQLGSENTLFLEDVKHRIKLKQVFPNSIIDKITSVEDLFLLDF